MPIHVLEPAVAAQIAAGEVVERPASVVKELVENALDAGARRITVSVRGGGIEEIVIQDDGGGIPADEIEVAFARHATSKLTSADDLWAIHTLGFRGEALPSIAAIAQVICTSRTASAETGAELRIAGAEVQAITPRGGSVGTTFTIRNLFYNVPVRREFLKSAAAEAAAIAAVVTQYALAYPQIAFTLMRDGKRIFQTSGRGQLPDVVLELYGVEVARQMFPIDARAGEDLGAVHIQGLVSAPTLSRSARDGMHLAVNGRAIQARGQLSAIIEEAYHTLLMKGRFPLVVLHVQVHPAAVDVNVHPTKSEVRFRHPQQVAHVLGQAVRDVVQGAAVIQGWDDPAGAPDRAGSETPNLAMTPAPAGTAEAGWLADAAAPGDTSIPSEGVDGAAGRSTAAARADVPRVDPGAEPALARSFAADRAPIQTALLDQQARAAGMTDYERVEDMDDAGRIAALQALDQQSVMPRVRETSAQLDSFQNAAPPEPATAPDELPMPTTPAPGLPPLRALAQLAQTYLLTEGPAGALYLIDQHAAHERITYERLLAQHSTGAIHRQALLLPQQIALPPDAQQALLAAMDELAEWGFKIEEADHGVQVHVVPAGLALEDLAMMLPDLAGLLGGRGGQTPADRRDATLATLACHTSVRAGQTLTLVEQQALIDQLAGCEGPRTCPHGRPTLIVLTKHQLERQFGRLGA